ncbi:hypothetical protein [Variovorax paradoxus]|uniref:hypothetical protein n=1 Tax=Variovorax paradoxus TaxID=34073 RepID=UPI0029C8FD47|nr:hypothetical protein [Variovorax paradoxus]WPH23473.1 hypothetical protein RZE78_30960 [Variovorax paradoxus]
MTDNIFARAHSLQRPADGQRLPVLLQDNPSRDYVFPVSVEEAAAALERLPAQHREGITHIWLRGRTRHQAGPDASLAEFICGSGVRVVVLYAWPADGVLTLGRRQPPRGEIAHFIRFGGVLRQTRGSWTISFEMAGLRRFYLEHLLCHEVGHHVDWFTRFWSKANAKKVEAAADQYAYAWGPLVSGKILEPERSF